MDLLNKKAQETNLNYDKSILKIEEVLNNMSFNIYKRNWSQLELKYKKEKINEFIETNCNEYNIENRDELLDIIIKIVSKQKNNKLFKYNKEDCKLVEIKGLKFENNSYITSFV